MKHGSFKAVCLIVLASFAALSSYGDEATMQFESVVLEAFNGDTAHQWNDGSRVRSYEYSWKVDASKFTTKSGDVTYPQQTYVDAWPVAAFGYNRDGNNTLKSLGVHGRFDRRGYNWIDLYPVNGDNADPFEIPLPGRVQYLDMWVWGSNFNFYIEAYLRDYQGVVHRLQLGNIAYTGWKNLRVHIPNSVPQNKRILPRLAGLKFVKFRIWTQPVERVADFYIYFKQLKILTDMFESLYDGDELADPDHVQELWANGGNAGASN